METSKLIQLNEERMVQVQGKRSGIWYGLLIVLLLLTAPFVWRWTRPPDVGVAGATVSVGMSKTPCRPLARFCRSTNLKLVLAFHVQFRQHVRAGQLLVTMKDPFANSRVAAADASPQSAEVSRENVQHNGSQEDRINFASDLDHAQAERPMLSALSTRCRTSARRGMKGS